VVKLLVILIRGYQQFISPFLGPRCRFYPSCSHYALDALQNHGLLRGGGLAVWRLLRCGPWTSGGFDPVPEQRAISMLKRIIHTDTNT